MGKGGCALSTKPASATRAPDDEIRGMTTVGVPTRKICPTLLRTKSTPADCWIAYEGIVYDVTRWLTRHPGGMRTILGNSGRDGTAVMLAMHDRQSLECSLRRMRKVGRLVSEGVGEQALPVLSDKSVQQKQRRDRTAAIERDFLLLDERLTSAGWYDTPTTHLLRPYYAAILRSLVILGAGVTLTLNVGHYSTEGGISASLLLGSTFLGLFLQQIAFIGHDAGHGSISGKLCVDAFLGLVVGNALAGIDISWWKSTHNVHHGATNSVHDDPDIQHLPLFCFHEKMVEPDSSERTSTQEEKHLGLWSTYHGRYMTAGDLSRYFIRYQHIYFYPVMAFARINLYIQSIIHLWRICPFVQDKAKSKTKVTLDDESNVPIAWPKATPAMWTLQVLSLCIFYGTWYVLLTSVGSALNAIVVIVVSTMVAGILHVQILLSHAAMHYHRHTAGLPASLTKADTNENEVGFHELQALTTMDIACHPSLDWIHGGLQFQLEHHLFPRMPKSRLRSLIPLVDQIFAKHDIPVVRKGFIEGNVMVLKHLARVGQTVSMCKLRPKES